MVVFRKALRPETVLTSVKAGWKVSESGLGRVDDETSVVVDDGADDGPDPWDVIEDMT